MKKSAAGKVGLTLPWLAGAGPNARPRRGALLSSGAMTSSCSVNRAMSFLVKMIFQNNCTNIKNDDKSLAWA